MNSDPQSSHSNSSQGWSWWPLLPTYPYGKRLSRFTELIACRAWAVEQFHGIWYVAVPIRMTVLRLDQGGLLLYSPLPPTQEVLNFIRKLESTHGYVRTIVLASSSGLEHKTSLPALARAFPNSDIWISAQQWSFPLDLPLSWLGFPRSRTHVLFKDGLPHSDEIDWLALGPLNLGLGTFLEVACHHRSSGVLLITDALVSIPKQPPILFDLDPNPLLYHARDSGSEPMLDTPQQRLKGWQRIVLFANYLRPHLLQVRGFLPLVNDFLAADDRKAVNHFGFYPFLWPNGWLADVDEFFAASPLPIRIAPVLERLVFVRARHSFVAWLRDLALLADEFALIPSHYDAPVLISSHILEQLAESIETRPWAPDHGSWQVLARLDALLLRYGLVPASPTTPEN
jgi:hypothetical protein